MQMLGYEVPVAWVFVTRVKKYEINKMPEDFLLRYIITICILMFTAAYDL
jgi:hypothetical protein